MSFLYEEWCSWKVLKFWLLFFLVLSISFVCVEVWILYYKVQRIDGFSIPGTAILFYSNNRMVNRCLKTIKQVRTIGRWNGDMVYIYDESLLDKDVERFERIGVVTKFFPSPDVVVGATRSWKQGRKFFRSYYSKFNAFNTWFRKWDRILYLDCGVFVFNDLVPFFDAVDVKNSLVAHYDQYPVSSTTMKLGGMFDPEYDPIIWKKFTIEYGDCLLKDHFITAMLYYDTSIIENNTVSDLVKINREYPISINHEQGIMGVYFMCVKQNFKPLPERKPSLPYFDFWEREIRHGEKDSPLRSPNEYIMLKYCRQC